MFKFWYTAFNLSVESIWSQSFAQQDPGKDSTHFILMLNSSYRCGYAYILRQLYK